MRSPRTLADIAASLPPAQWSARLADAEVLERALARVRTGASRTAALRELFPDPDLPSLLRRLRIDELGGRDALIHRHLPAKTVRKMDEEARGALRALALTDPPRRLGRCWPSGCRPRWGVRSGRPRCSMR